MSTNSADEGTHHDGAEPVYGPAYSTVPTGATQGATATEGRAAVPGAAAYPPYPGGTHAPVGISTPVACGLAYFTILPAIVFLLLEPYRSQPLVRFHSWQSIFYFLAVAGIRIVELLLVSMLPVTLAYTISGLFSLTLFALWLVAVIKAFQGSKYLLPVVGSYAEQTASSASVR